MRSLTDALRSNNYDADPMLRSSGISISAQFTQVEGRVLSAPRLKVGNGEDFFPRNGRWNFNNKKLVDTCNRKLGFLLYWARKLHPHNWMCIDQHTPCSDFHSCSSFQVLRQESVGIKKTSGQAKLLGTVVCVGGAMLLSFYHGRMINIGESSIHWNYADSTGNSSTDKKSNFILGSIFIMASVVSWAIWFTVQAKVSLKFPAPYTCTLLMCFMGSIECVVIGVGANHKVSEWSLRSPRRLVAALYAGIVCSALAFSLTSWSIQRKGALYVSVFSPLLLVIVAALSWALLHEKIYVGTYAYIS
ncbi:hypothetical protein DKX38_017792 [Salix brachista]|uniref:WAT1-related protein n=1 Tax=Salix brachista TaxID=2182728 RepID=A0A5N5KXJ5_9ROSI|nr:hypothetical protein DKX38_017792 [Salix brachista]